ncbi:vesicle-associated protein 1-3-like isoform X2 [Olea europaea var. sylvestris]|uniref:vesicle-associated protein 1-3-like isoform X2 n=1 Tax=Olea europaea var. sylvestris TaxID=158386 RepID=UPI000C1CF878|nr:vesicle-associated protein 1-3-like isoform X2 [Olea europaea var. sylvestris]
MGDFLYVQPSELKFPYELRKQSSCSVQLINKTDQYIAFKVKTTSPKRYCVRPNAGVVLPNSVCNVTVIMQAHKEAPADMQCKDKFLIQSVVAPSGTTNKDITAEMFNRKEDKIVNEVKLRVVYIPANPPSPVPEGDEEGSPRTSSVEDDNRTTSLPEAVTRLLDKSNGKSSSSEAKSKISKITEEKASAIQQNKKLQEELELLKRQTGKTRAGGSASMFVVLVSLFLGILVGYFIYRA